MSDPRYVPTDETGELTEASLAGIVPCCSPLVGVTPDGAIKVSATPAPGTPTASSWGTDTINTAGSGTGYTALGSHAAGRVLIVNPSVALDVRKVGGTSPVTMAANSGLELSVIANANEIEVRRNDLSVTPVAVNFVFAS